MTRWIACKCSNKKSMPLHNSFPRMELCAFETPKPPTFYTARSSFRAVDQPAGSCVGSRVRAVLVSIRYFPLFPRPLLVTNLRLLADSQHERKHVLQSGVRRNFRNFPPFLSFVLGYLNIPLLRKNYASNKDNERYWHKNTRRQKSSLNFRFNFCMSKNILRVPYISCWDLFYIMHH